MYHADAIVRSARKVSREVIHPESHSDARIIVLAYHFFPSSEVGARRMSALAHQLKVNGQPVTVVSAFERLESLARDDVGANQLRDYDLIRVPVRAARALRFLVRMKTLLRQAVLPSSVAPAAGSESATSGDGARASLRRLVLGIVYLLDDKKRWSLEAALRLMRARRVGRGAVMIVSAPPLSPLLAAIVTGRWLRVPVIVDLRDPIFLRTEQGTADNRFFSQWGRRALERYVSRRAAHITTTSPSLHRLLRASYPQIADRISCIYNGFDDDPLPPRAGTGNRLVILYAGALYLNRNPFPFLEAVDDLLAQAGVDARRVELHFAGECEQYRGVALRGWLAGRTWSDAVSIHPRLEPAELGKLYDRATLLLNFAEGQRMQVPAKTFELLARGRELLVLCEPESDTGSIVRGMTGVSCVQSSDPIALGALLADIYRRHVVDGTLRAPLASEISRYSRSAQNERFMRVIEDVGKRPRLPIAV